MVRWPLVCLLVWTFVSSAAFGDQTKISSYSKARNLFWNKVHPSDTSSLYCGKFARRNRRFNLEHVFAASWMKGPGRCIGMSRESCRKTSRRFNHMEADLHNLYPALAWVNKSRSSYGFGIIRGPSNEPCDIEVDTKQGLFEPPPAARGNIARALLYFFHEYNIAWESIHAERPELLYAWHCNDPVSDSERTRNEIIYSLQGTRNPYIDKPSIIDCDDVPSFPQD